MDPFAENCLKYARQSCQIITNELMQAHLIVTQVTDVDLVSHNEQVHA